MSAIKRMINIFDKHQKFVEKHGINLSDLNRRLIDKIASGDVGLYNEIMGFSTQNKN